MTAKSVPCQVKHNPSTLDNAPRSLEYTFIRVSFNHLFYGVLVQINLYKVVILLVSPVPYNVLVKVVILPPISYLFYWVLIFVWQLNIETLSKVKLKDAYSLEAKL